MGSKSKVQSQKAGKGAHEDAAASTDKPSFLTGGASIDPNLASLFESSVSLIDSNCRLYLWFYSQ